MPDPVDQIDNAPKPKRIVFCFDGSWNKLDAPLPTNVVLVAESVIPLTKGGTPQLIYYDEGVGTQKWDKYLGGIFGLGLLSNLVEAYRFLIFNFRPGDEIYVFGFSRGAFTARSFVGLLGCTSILSRRDAGKITEAILLYKSQETDLAALAETRLLFRQQYSCAVCVSQDEEDWRIKNVPGFAKNSFPFLRVRYLGVWDTVGALGIPGKYARTFNSRFKFHDTNLSGEFVEAARHAVAIDERRKNFAPTLWENINEVNKRVNSTPDNPEAPYQQKWFPGTHGSVGGGGEIGEVYPTRHWGG